MFRRRAGPPGSTVIGAGVALQGTIRSRGVMEICGQVEGHIEHEGRLVIGAGALCRSSIRATSLEVAGEVRGNVQVAERLTILATGRLYGDVRWGTLLVQAGGVLAGTSLVDGAPDEPVAAEQAAAGAAPPPRRLEPDHPFRPRPDPDVQVFQGSLAINGTPPAKVTE